MAEHLWTVVCSRHLIDPDEHTSSLIDVMESVAVEGLAQKIDEALKLEKKGTFIDVPMVLVSWWFRSDAKEETLRVRFNFVDPVGASLFNQPAEMKWADNSSFSRLFVKVQKLPTTMLGLYWFVVEQLSSEGEGEPEWVPMARVPLGIDSAD
jgi:hypothetical protein